MGHFNIFSLFNVGHYQYTLDHSNYPKRMGKYLGSERTYLGSERTKVYVMRNNNKLLQILIQVQYNIMTLIAPV